MIWEEMHKLMGVLYSLYFSLLQDIWNINQQSTITWIPSNIWTIHLLHGAINQLQGQTPRHLDSRDKGFLMTLTATGNKY
jgi:hypothetical protein